MTKIASVMFVCVHNAGRSQMAQGFLTELAGDRIEVRSSGTMPADSVDALPLLPQHINIRAKRKFLILHPLLLGML